MKLSEQISEHYKLEEYSKIADLLFPDLTLRQTYEEGTACIEIVDKIPEDVLKSSIKFCSILACHKWNDGKLAEGDKWFLNAMLLRDASKEESEERINLNLLCSMIGIKNPAKDNAHLMLNLSIIYNEYLRSGQRFPGMTATNALPSVLRGYKDMSEWTENYRAVRSILRPIISAVFDNNGQGLIETAVGEIMYEQNKHDEAVVEIAKAMASNDIEMMFASRGVLAKINRLDKSATQPKDILAEVQELLVKEENAYIRANFEAFKVRLAMEKGDLEAVSAWLEESGCKVGNYAIRKLYCQITTAKCYIALERYKDAVVMLEGLIDMLRGVYRPIDLAECLANAAIVYELMGSKDIADERFARALKITKPNGYVRIYADLGNSIIPIVDRYKEKYGENAYINKICASANEFTTLFPKLYVKDGVALAAQPEALEAPMQEQAAEVQADEVDLLTQTESDILKLLSDGKTNNEIASAMSIKLTTVKFHVKNIMEKLGAKNRTEAIKIAREKKYLQ